MAAIWFSVTQLNKILWQFNLSQADRLWYTYGPSALASLAIQLLWCTGVGQTEAYRTVRAYLADHPRLLSGHIIGVTEAYRCIWQTVRATIFCWSEPLVKNFMNGGPSASYPRTVRPTNFRQPRILPTFTISTLNWDLCSNKIPKISKLAWTPSKDSYEWVRMINQK